MTRVLRITLGQINPILGNFDFNTGLMLKVAKQESASDLIVFPELSICGYPPEDLILKPFFLDHCDKIVDDIVAASKNLESGLIIGAPYREDGKVYNAAHLIENGKILTTIKKHHLPNYGVFDEVRVFDPAPPAEPIKFRGTSLGIMVCEDMWQPDVAANLKAHGAELLISINASPYEKDKNTVRLERAKARVLETGLPLIYVNQAGGQDELVFDGASFVLNESAQKILQAEEFVEDIHHTTWEKREDSEHWLCSTDTIIPLHEGDDAIYQAVMTGLRDYVTKNGFPGVIVGLSGGIDSALAATIAVDALGSSAVRGVTMPSRYTSNESLEDAGALARNLGIHIDTISIESPIESFEETLAPHFTSSTPDITFENLQSRTRGLILMALSNASGHMVMSTGNKSEMAVGYATLYGDMCGGFNPLKDLYKTQVYKLSRWRNENKPDHALGEKKLLIPERTITKPPSAELKPDQTDQDTLPDYEILDDILRSLIEKESSVNELIEKGHKKDLVLRVWSMLDRAEYKRRQSPPGVKITSRAFGRDRRYPITNHFTGDHLKD